MNLIELSEQLKDVPDQFLTKEVQAPSGAYPAYLVVSELTRRKRMRESAMKEAPSTTVVEDLAAPSPMGGLGALPEAQGSLAAQDAMGTTPPEMMMPAQDTMMPVQGMAGGGMVSFNSGGDVRRFSNGGFSSLPIYNRPSAGPAGSMGELMYNMIPSFGALTNEELRVDPVTGQPVSLGQYLRLEDERKAAASRSIGNPQNVSTLVRAQSAAEESFSPTVSGALNEAPVQAPSVQGAGGPPRLPSIPQSQFGQTGADAFKKLLESQGMTDQKRNAAALAGSDAYKQAVQYRYEPFEKELESKTKDLEGRRASNINEALIQAGLGIMGSKSPYLGQAIAEGGLGGLKAYREGVKDLRDAEKDLMSSRMKMAEARTNYDKEGYLAGQTAAQSAQKRIESEQERLAKIVSASSTLGKEERERAMLPFEIDTKRAAAESSRAYARYLGEKQPGSTISDADQKAAEESARKRAMESIMTNPNIRLGSPEYQALVDKFYMEELARRSAGLNYRPSQSPSGPLDRGTL